MLHKINDRYHSVSDSAYFQNLSENMKRTLKIDKKSIERPQLIIAMPVKT
jgi:hypothetical protein